MANKRTHDLDKIEADLACGMHIHYIRLKYNLTRNQAAGIYWRFWHKRGRKYYLEGALRLPPTMKAKI